MRPLDLYLHLEEEMLDLERSGRWAAADAVRDVMDEVFDSLPPANREWLNRRDDCLVVDLDGTTKD